MITYIWGRLFSRPFFYITVEKISGIKTNIVQTFVNLNEEIVEFQKINNNYILVTEKKKRNWFLSIVFETSDWSNIYYYCSLKNNKVEKIEKIHTKNKGIMF